MKKKSTSTDFSLALNEINDIHREIQIKESANELIKQSTTKNKTNPLLESYETPDMQSIMKRYWPGTMIEKRRS